MSGSVNRVYLIGNLGKDPEIRSTQSGERIASFSLATSETWRDKAGERQERTAWHNIVVFNERLVETIEKFLHKGSKIYVDGSLQYRKYTDKQGIERQVTEIVLSRYRGEFQMLDSASDTRREPQERVSASNYGPLRAGDPPKMSDLDDEIPF